MFKKKPIKLVFILSMVVILLSGCGLYGPEETMEIDPPPITEMQNNAGTTLEVNELLPEQVQMATNEENQQLVNVTIYYFDQTGDVVPLTMDIPKVEGIGQEVLEYMTMNGPANGLLPTGFRPVLPAGTKFTMNVKTEEKLAIIDFSREFLSYEAANASEEKKILDAITWSLTEFPTIEQVELRVNGYPLETMPTFKTPVIGPLSRLDGINIELANNINIGQTTPITLYFNRVTEDGEYLVPITRLIQKTDDLAKATLEQLILGPKSGTDLSVGLLPTTKILDIQLNDQIIVADFDEELLGVDQQLSPQVIDSIVLSLTENIEAASVQIKIKGENKPVSKPVNRPININASVL